MTKTHYEEGTDVTSPLDVLEVTVVTPEATVLKSPAQFLALPLYDGEIGIAPGRAPLIGRLGYGEMRLKVGDKTLRYYIDGGFVEVSKNFVTVLTSRATAAEKIDAAVVHERLKVAQQKPANTPELLEIRERAVAAARGQLWVARKGTGH